MPLFMALHKWSKEEEVTVLKELSGVLTAVREKKLPQGIELCAVYETGDQRIYYVWNTPSMEVLEKMLGEYLPVVRKGSELVSVVQMYPPTVEYTVALFQGLIPLVSK